MVGKACTVTSVRGIVARIPDVVLVHVFVAFQQCKIPTFLLIALPSSGNSCGGFPGEESFFESLGSIRPY